MEALTDWYPYTTEENPTNKHTVQNIVCRITTVKTYYQPDYRTHYCGGGLSQWKQMAWIPHIWEKYGIYHQEIK